MAGEAKFSSPAINHPPKPLNRVYANPEPKQPYSEKEFVMPIAIIRTQNESFTVYRIHQGFYAIGEFGTRTPTFFSVEKLQDHLENQSRILKTFSRYSETPYQAGN
jgi:hypothetical protein